MSATGVSPTMRLALFAQPTGHHQSAWRHPDSQPDGDVNIDHLVYLARTAERAKFDAIFFADAQYVRHGDPSVVGRVAQYVATIEPLTLAAALSMTTSQIGLIVTASTTFNYPYQLARKLASIDHMSRGRIGWNIVTSSPFEAANFGLSEHLDHGDRYARAAEFVEACKSLWDSWEDEAFIRDQSTGIFSDFERMHAFDYKGKFLATRGPLNLPRSPQGYPLLVQAGASPAGVDFASQHAEMVFSTPLTLNDGQDQYRDIKTRVEHHGRNPDHVAVMPGFVVLAAPTDAGAEEEYQRLQSLLHPDVALNILSIKLSGSGPRIDLSEYPLDEPLPLSAEPTGPERVYFRSWYDVGQAENLTLRQLAARAAGSYAGMELRGSGQHIADVMEEWFRQGAADGFNIMPSYLPGGLDRFVEFVIPELRRRGLCRTEYDGTTLRDHFGLPRPAWHAHPQLIEH